MKCYNVWGLLQKAEGKVSARREQQDCSQANNCQSWGMARGSLHYSLHFHVYLNPVSSTSNPPSVPTSDLQPHLSSTYRNDHVTVFAFFTHSFAFFSLKNHPSSIPSNLQPPYKFQSRNLPFSPHLSLKSWSHCNSSLPLISSTKR